MLWEYVLSSVDQLRLISALLEDENPLRTITGHPLPIEGAVGTVAELMEYVNGFIGRYGRPPSRSTVKQEVGVSLPPAPEPYLYYRDQVQKQYKYNLLAAELGELRPLMMQKEVDAVAEKVLGLARQLQQIEARQSLVNMRTDAQSLVLGAYVQARKAGGVAGITLGWPYLDDMVGGLVPGDFMGIVGRPSSGKSYLLLAMALHVWQQKKVPMVVSMEMAPLLIMQRVLAMHGKLPVTQLKKARLSTRTHKRLVQYLEGLHDYPDFWVLDGNLTATAQDVAWMAQQIKPDVVLVDGAYLLGYGEGHRMAKWERIGSVAEALKKDVAARLGIPVVCSYQLNREYVKESKKSKSQQTSAGLEHIAGTDVIGQVASVVLGLMQDESVEVVTTRRVDVLKGRSGEQGSFEINWIFDMPPFMDFSQVVVDEDGGAGGRDWGGMHYI